MREAGLALIIAMAGLLPLSVYPPARDLETASLDLRFRIRGALPPDPETVVVLVDEDSIKRLGRWPLSRRLYGKAVETLDHAGARVIAFDLLFAEPEQPVPAALREVARAAGTGCSGSANSKSKAMT